MDLKYDLIGLGEVKQIRALRDFSDVKQGDLGGYVVNTIVSHHGDAWIYSGTVKNSFVCGDTKVYNSNLTDSVMNNNAVVKNSSLTHTCVVDDGYVEDSTLKSCAIYDRGIVSGRVLKHITVRLDQVYKKADIPKAFIYFLAVVGFMTLSVMAGDVVGSIIKNLIK